ncbi:hematopoietic progenitor cell antigen CD34 isoform X1 [Apteryx mantelli]|uniref:Hematopoietic progenitor cell antigen CD34 isoform X1 n=2 Tax=Apteryx mantelli TaxID=2696672 RepID=A0ABM4FPB0_9AVES
MLLLGSLKIMKGRQLLWIAFCVVTLWGRAAGSPTDAPVSTASAPRTGASSSETATDPPSTASPTSETAAAPTSPTTAPTSAALSTSPQPGQTSSHRPDMQPDPPTVSGEPPATTDVPTARPTTAAAVTTAPESALPGSPTAAGRTAASARPTPSGRASDGAKSITCHQVKEVRDTEAICLHLKESDTCKHFLEMKGSELWSAICEEGAHRVPSPCQIKLAKSEVDRDCMLLILVGERDPATDMLQESHWEKFGIKSLKRGSVRSHQDFSRKTLIALVTSGLLLAFLGLAGYFLMKRRSWSPMGERLGEDPYYMENGSQGNATVTTAPHEPPEPQEKPNLNGGAQENGTGQASSQNGRSAKQHSVADTQM